MILAVELVWVSASVILTIVPRERGVSSRVLTGERGSTLLKMTTGMSSKLLTVTVTVSLAVRGPPLPAFPRSSIAKLIVVKPKKRGDGVYLKVSKIALRRVSVPLTVTVLEPSERIWSPCLEPVKLTEPSETVTVTASSDRSARVPRLNNWLKGGEGGEINRYR